MPSAPPVSATVSSRIDLGHSASIPVADIISATAAAPLPPYPSDCQDKHIYRFRTIGGAHTNKHSELCRARNNRPEVKRFDQLEAHGDASLSSFIVYAVLKKMEQDQSFGALDSHKLSVRAIA